eukprot:414516_1
MNSGQNIGDGTFKRGQCFIPRDIQGETTTTIRRLLLTTTKIKSDDMKQLCDGLKQYYTQNGETNARRWINRRIKSIKNNTKRGGQRKKFIQAPTDPPMNTNTSTPTPQARIPYVHQFDALNTQLPTNTNTSTLTAQTCRIPHYTSINTNYIPQYSSIPFRPQVQGTIPNMNNNTNYVPQQPSIPPMNTNTSMPTTQARIPYAHQFDALNTHLPTNANTSTLTAQTCRIPHYTSIPFRPQVPRIVNPLQANPLTIPNMNSNTNYVPQQPSIPLIPPISRIVNPLAMSIPLFTLASPPRVPQLISTPDTSNVMTRAPSNLNTDELYSETCFECGIQIDAHIWGVKCSTCPNRMHRPCGATVMEGLMPVIYCSNCVKSQPMRSECAALYAGYFLKEWDTVHAKIDAFDRNGMEYKKDIKIKRWKMGKDPIPIGSVDGFCDGDTQKMFQEVGQRFWDNDEYYRAKYSDSIQGGRVKCGNRMKIHGENFYSTRSSRPKLTKCSMKFGKMYKTKKERKLVKIFMLNLLTIGTILEMSSECLRCLRNPRDMTYLTCIYNGNGLVTHIDDLFIGPVWCYVSMIEDKRDDEQKREQNNKIYRGKSISWGMRGAEVLNEKATLQNYPNQLYFFYGYFTDFAKHGVPKMRGFRAK